VARDEILLLDERIFWSNSNFRTFAFVVNLLGRTGELLEAIANAVDIVIWVAILTACWF